MSESLPKPVTYKAALAQSVITPPIGVSLAGYFHDRIAKSVRDDLHAKAMVIEHDDRRIVLVSCDLISIDAQTTDRTRELIRADLGIPPEHVMVCATHTHTGPELREDGVVPPARQWRDELPGKIAKMVRGAVDKLTPATLHLGSADAVGYSFNRLFRMKDGSEVFGRRGREDQVLGPAGPIDPQLQTLGVVGPEGKLLGMAVNFALHVDVIGGGSANFISADWPGEMARAVAGAYGSDVVTMLFQGTCGDINHVPHDPTNLPRGGPAKAIQIGRGLAGVAMHASERAEPMTALTLDGRIQKLEIPYYTRDKAFLAELDALRAKPNRSPFEEYVIKRGESWPHDGKLADVPIQVLRIGDLGLVALPAEIFARIGLDIKHWSPAPATFVVELANARASTYVPTTDQAERGAYGAKPILSRWLCSDGGRRMADASVTMLHHMWA
ncbi:MAG: hypothetical protein JXQ73_08530 [Phycisphaerae bacterium]|nr:hypothetical protein [Phycisphaerae bacterium]